MLGGWGRSPPVFALLFSQAVRRCAAGAGTAVPGAARLPSRPYFSAVQRGALGACAAPEGALFCPLRGPVLLPPGGCLNARDACSFKRGLKRISTPVFIERRCTCYPQCCTLYPAVLHPLSRSAAPFIPHPSTRLFYLHQVSGVDGQRPAGGISHDCTRVPQIASEAAEPSPLASA